MQDGQPHGFPQPQGLYDPAFEHDACGVGFICHMKGKASNKIIADALHMLENMNHRGGCGCEPDSGDGAGILVKMPHAFFQKEAQKLGFRLPKPGEYGVGMIFLPRDDMVARHECERNLEQIVRQFGMKVLGWRDVPTRSEHIGPTPRRSEPKVRQIFVAPDEHFFNRSQFDSRLYLVRQRAENTIEFGDFSKSAKDNFYIPVLSANRLVYQGHAHRPFRCGAIIPI